MLIEMRREINEALVRMREDEGKAAIIITGAGASFPAGFDLGEFGKVDQ